MGASRAGRLELLRELERGVLWLSAWTIHHANHVRPKRDGLKVGGHQASCASLTTLMTALYFDVLRPQDRVAVKPHASPVFHAIQYLLGHQSRDRLERFRALGGAQAYPSRTKDADDVDFSTGSMALGVAITLFAALAQDYLRMKHLVPHDEPPGRMIALVGDAELDEGNIFEALLEGWKHDVRNVWWIVDYNRQSLDSVVEDRLFQRIDALFASMGWRVVTLKYGRELEAVFARRGGDALRDWIDRCPNSLYSALVYKGGSGWRENLLRDIGDVSGVRELLDGYDDRGLQELMTNLGGHDMASVLDAFHAVEDDQPSCFLAYTIKGRGLPFAGHKDNHAGLMSVEQMARFQESMGIPKGREWEPFEGLEITPDEARAFLADLPVCKAGRRRHPAPLVPVPAALLAPRSERVSTQEAFGRLLREIARDHPDLAGRVVTASPDVTVSTNLGGWVNARGLFYRRERSDVFRDEHVQSAQKWEMSPAGQHIELGIAENNFFLQLAALGLTGPLFGTRLLPIGALYDPFISRGLDALNYACYQDSRFLLVGTPSGLSLAPEGGAHQSILTPLVGIGQPGLVCFEPAYADELAALMAFAFEYMQAESGSSVYLRLSTRPIEQPKRELTPALRDEILRGGYWAVPPGPGVDLAIAYTGVIATEALKALEMIREDVPGVGLLAITSADRLHADWREAQAARARGETGAAAHIEELLGALGPGACLVTVLDGHPATLSWIGAVRSQHLVSLGVEDFGESGNVPDLYRAHGIDAGTIVNAAARALLDRMA
jgi:pyruvate dehydrogenase E1 component